MRKQIFLLLLFPLALDAQQVPRNPIPTGATKFFAEEASVTLAPIPTKASETALLPDAPAPRIGTNNEADALPVAAYVTTRPRQPEPAVERVRVFNKKFIAVHAAYLGSIVYDTELTHEGLAHHRCVESNASLGTHPSRGEMYQQNMLAFSAIGGLDWLTAKLKLRYLPYITPVVGSAVHLTGGSKWLTGCW
jgi:hypothetical protein